ncbi:hypothetical protein N665_0259s0032 [Sinapis alba]|nr:hypothetical protein N665_0259s0032 [Sinapis alba]
MSTWTRVQPEYAANMWNKALNKQLVTQELDLFRILEETVRREMSFDELLYSPSLNRKTFVFFILAMYKAAGASALSLITYKAL